ncbi:sensor histidine kinase [Actinoplanes palleronii]|uniref:histidine kinase n=1 Tax=Actinoplanes palleronii TaxID=113570 RepID=A0ABQ4BUR2_9ACTN|nr:HAMP domain-containing sensor histidine kinase [Actinoplanes palleronii]GIE73915.1 two-component sensor histidine kinase [Actinoplanes palleronii]
MTPDRPPGGLRRLPLRVRLIAGFAVAMLVVLTGAGAFVYLRVRYALDLRLNDDLTAQAGQLTTSITAGGPPTVTTGTEYQLLDPAGQVVDASTGLTGASLLSASQLVAARTRALRADRGPLFPIRANTLRLYAVPLPASAGPVVAVVALRRDQRDEALRELIGQLALANLAALAIASVVGYRLTRAALAPVERYRTEAARIAAGATGLRLAVPDRSDDEITRLGHTLNQMLTALDAALQRERQFVHDASHELRTPLTLLSTEIELALRRQRSTSELEQTLRNVAADADRLRELADTLLTVGVQPSPAPGATVDLGVLAAETAARYPHTRVLHHEPAVAFGDAVRLRQVLTNLLDNAVRHGRPPVTVTTRRSDDLVYLRVHDHGSGMDPAFLSVATARFTRADTSRSTPGTGLGLAVVDAIITAHHGELRICANGTHHQQPGTTPTPGCDHPHDGTTITVLLPAAKPSTAGDIPHAPQQ